MPSMARSHTFVTLKGLSVSGLLLLFQGCMIAVCAGGDDDDQPTLFADGRNCNRNSVCASKKCLIKCCNSNGQQANCARCGGGGNCVACSSNLVLINGVCRKQIDGGDCRADGDCQSSSCLSNICCSEQGKHPKCVACAGGGGHCSQCSDVWILNTNTHTCDYNTGDVCTETKHCATLDATLCFGGHCCKQAVFDDSGGCDACDDKGECTSCTSVTTFKNKICVPRSNLGETCSTSDDCLNSVTCRTNCCNSVSLANCKVCGTDNGMCATCVHDYVLNPLGVCMPTSLAPGGTCSYNNQCAYPGGQCIKNRCCKANVSEYCIDCNVGSGACVECGDGYYTNAGTCAAIKAKGSVCTHNKQCYSLSQCRGSTDIVPTTSVLHCCGAVDAKCNLCNDTGACVSCIATHALVGVVCVTKQDVGSTCSAGSSCQSGVCQRGLFSFDDSYCCVSAGCRVCTQGGDCLCNTSDYFQVGVGTDHTAGCELKRGDGAECSRERNESCASGVCLGGGCCTTATTTTKTTVAPGLPSLDAQCVSCLGNGGACVACADGFELSEQGVCVLTAITTITTSFKSTDTVQIVSTSVSVSVISTVAGGSGGGSGSGGSGGGVSTTTMANTNSNTNTAPTSSPPPSFSIPTPTTTATGGVVVVDDDDDDKDGFSPTFPPLQSPTSTNNNNTTNNNNNTVESSSAAAQTWMVPVIVVVVIIVLAITVLVVCCLCGCCCWGGGGSRGSFDHKQETAPHAAMMVANPLHNNFNSSNNNNTTNNTTTTNNNNFNNTNNATLNNNNNNVDDDDISLDDEPQYEAADAVRQKNALGNSHNQQHNHQHNHQQHQQHNQQQNYNGHYDNPVYGEEHSHYKTNKNTDATTDNTTTNKHNNKNNAKHNTTNRIHERDKYSAINHNTNNNNNNNATLGEPLYGVEIIADNVTNQTPENWYGDLPFPAEEKEKEKKEIENEVDLDQSNLNNRDRSASVVRSGYSIPVENSEDFEESDYAPIIHTRKHVDNDGVVVGTTAVDFDHYTTSNNVRRPSRHPDDHHRGTINSSASDSKGYYSPATAQHTKNTNTQGYKNARDALTKQTSCDDDGYLLTEGTVHRHAYETPPNVAPTQPRKQPKKKQPQQELVYDTNGGVEDDEDSSDDNADTLEEYAQVSTLRRDRSGSRV